MEDLVESGGEKGNVGRETNEEPEDEIPTHLQRGRRVGFVNGKRVDSDRWNRSKIQKWR